MPTATEIVRSFCEGFADADPDQLASYFAEDAVYHNIPMDPIEGREDIRAALAGFLGMVDELRFEVRNLLAGDELVMTERVDHFVRPEGTISLPVMGTFEVRAGLITAWRDYFDLNQFMTQMSPGD